MQAMTGNVSMQTSTILNQGTISAVMGNIAVANLTNNLAINALGGTFSAANGTIDIGTKTLTDKLNLQIMGGDFISKTLNLQAGTCGQVSMQSNSVAGVLNVNSAGDASISTDSLLNIGNFQVGGDPYIQSNDDIYISASDAFGLGTLMVDSGGSIFCQGGIARADEYINGSLNPGSVYLWAEKDINLGGNVQASGNVTMIARNGSINAPNTSMLVGGIMFLTAAGGSLTVDSITSTAVGKYDPGVPGMFSYSVSAFAHNDLNVNSVNALNSVMIRGSGNYSNGICYAGFNPGSVTVGKVNVKNAASYAEIYIDDWGGPIKTGSIQMAGTSSPGGRAISISGPNISVGSITNNSMRMMAEVASVC